MDIKANMGGGSSIEWNKIDKNKDLKALKAALD